MRGVPRILKAEHFSLKIIWAVTVLLLVAFAIYQVTQVVGQYLKNEYFMTVKESSFHPTDDKPVYPSITVCNQNPFSSELRELGTMARFRNEALSLQSYYKRVEIKSNCSKYQLRTHPFENYLCQSLLSLSGYFQYIGMDKVKDIGHTLDSFIINCEILILSGLMYSPIPCENLTDIAPVYNPEYLQCFHLNITNDYFLTEGLVTGIKLVLHLDSSRLGRPKDDGLNDIIRPQGAVITPHHPDMPAFPTLDGIFIPAGSSSRIQSEIRKRVRLPEPYSQCKEGSFEGYEKMKMCVAECISENIIAQCGCISVNLAVDLNKNPSSLPFCNDIGTISFQELKNVTHCVRQGSNLTILERCFEQCPLSCKEYQYIHETSSSKWPNMWQLQTFYEKYIKSRNYESNYRFVRDILNNEKCKTYKNCYAELTAAYQIIEHNFLEVSYTLSDHRYLKLVDVPKTFLADLCSQIGGILNLWSGITILVLLEVIELSCRMLKNWGENLPIPRRSLRRRNNEQHRRNQDSQFDGFTMQTEYGTNNNSTEPVTV